MAVKAQPLMVEIKQTPQEIANAKCADCKHPLGYMHGRAFRGVTSDGQFLIQVICLNCAKREMQMVDTGKYLPAPPIYRRRRAYALMSIAAASAVFSIIAGILTLVGMQFPVALLVAVGPLSLLALPGFYYYGQGVTQTRRVEKAP